MSLRGNAGLCQELSLWLGSGEEGEQGSETRVSRMSLHCCREAEQGGRSRASSLPCGRRGEQMAGCVHR